MKKYIGILIISAFQIGCTVNPVPQNYRGPLSYITDSVSNSQNTRADFFILEKVNGKSIDTSVMKTLNTNSGSGLRMSPVVMVRAVPAESAIFTITGRVLYAAPILAFGKRDFRVSGDIKFTPEPNIKYVVKGALTYRQSEVCIEEELTGKIVEKKIASVDNKNRRW